MNVYILDADVNKYRGIYYVNEENVVEFNRRFDGTSLKRNWTGKDEFRFIPERLARGDTPGLSSHIPVFNSRAVRVLADLLEAGGELLPITCEGEDYFLFNVTLLVDALDEARCEIERFDDGRIMDIESHFFVEKKLTGAVVFKLPQDPLGGVYVTDVFVERVKRNNLKGFKFRHVWRSEEDMRNSVK